MINDNFSDVKNELVRADLPGPMIDETLDYLRVFLDDKKHKRIFVCFPSHLCVTVNLLSKSSSVNPRFVDLNIPSPGPLVNLNVSRTDPYLPPMNVDILVDVLTGEMLAVERVTLKFEAR